MLYIHSKPPVALARCIRALWYWESPTQPHGFERIMPTGTANLIINLHEGEVRNYQQDGAVQRHCGSILVGAQSAFGIIDTQEQRAVLGVEFRPGGTWPLFGVAGDELSNQHIGLTDLWSEAGSLRDRILCAPSPQSRLQILADSLTAQLASCGQQHPAVALALRHLHHAPQLATVEELSREAGISTRRLARLFSIEVGLTPKLYARVLRFNRVVESVYNSSSIDWTELAVRCGYFDQAHFIRDFKAFSGLTPGDYLSRRTPYAHHVRL